MRSYDAEPTSTAPLVSRWAPALARPLLDVLRRGRSAAAAGFRSTAARVPTSVLDAFPDR